MNVRQAISTWRQWSEILCDGPTPLVFEDLLLSLAMAGSTISTLLHDRINPKDCQVLFLGDTGFLQFVRVVSRDYGKPRMGLFIIM